MKIQDETTEELVSKAEAYAELTAWQEAGDGIRNAIETAYRYAFWEGVREGHRLAGEGYDLPEDWDPGRKEVEEG